MQRFQGSRQLSGTVFKLRFFLTRRTGQTHISLIFILFVLCIAFVSKQQTKMKTFKAGSVKPPITNKFTVKVAYHGDTWAQRKKKDTSFGGKQVIGKARVRENYFKHMRSNMWFPNAKIGFYNKETFRGGLVHIVEPHSPNLKRR